MLKPLPAFLLCSALLFPLLGDRQPAAAQERQGCFMVNSAGRLIDLSNLCPAAQATTQVAAAPQNLGTGDIQVTLRWASADDLDLAVTDPSAQTVTYANTRVPSGGQLDVDANAGCGSTTTTPIENVFWPPAQAPQGAYQVVVSLFARCASPGTPIPFTLTLLVQGETQTLNGTVSEQNPIATFPFTLPRSPQP